MSRVAPDVSPEGLRRLSLPAVLQEGTEVRVRSILSSDKDRLQIGFHRLSPLQNPPEGGPGCDPAKG